MPVTTEVQKVVSREPLFNAKGSINRQSMTQTKLEALHSTVPCPAEL